MSRTSVGSSMIADLPRDSDRVWAPEAVRSTRSTVSAGGAMTGAEIGRCSTRAGVR
ncbi:hypothetical protein D3C87_1838060 [compost metagenome]